MSTPAKVHLHSEQFDGWLHAQCGAGEWKSGSPRCVEADEFEKLPRAMRCKHCSRYWFPNGEPDDILTDYQSKSNCPPKTFRRGAFLPVT
jgi:hypothetical protein